MRRTCIACWIPKATTTHSTVVSRTPLDVTLHVQHTACLVHWSFVSRSWRLCFYRTLPPLLEVRPSCILRSGLDREIGNPFPARSDVFRLSTTTSERLGRSHSPIKWRRPFGPGGISPAGPNLIVQLNPSAQDPVTLQTVSLATLTVPYSVVR